MKARGPGDDEASASLCKTAMDLGKRVAELAEILEEPRLCKAAEQAPESTRKGPALSTARAVSRKEVSASDVHS